jgi:xyloglucan-specific endo-beta-1,4-glucanase
MGGSGGTSRGSGGVSGSTAASTTSVGGANGGSGGMSSGSGGIGGGGTGVGTGGGSGGMSGGSGGMSGGSGGTNDGIGGSGVASGGTGGRSGTGGIGVGTGGASLGGASGGAGGAAGRSGTGGAGGTGGGMGGASGAAGGTGGGSTGSSGTCIAGSTKIGNTCQSGWGSIMGKYILNNNWWGTSGATGEQCLWGTCQDGDVVGWVTNWNWSGGTSSVLTYTSIVFGWQYGFQVSNTGLPIQVSTNKAINCGWDFALTQTSGAYNVAYDIWLHTSANPPSNGGQSDEIMIWLNEAGNPAPAGSTYASGISIAGTTWNLWEGNVGWPVHSYVRTSNTSSAVMNVMAFMGDLVSRGRIPNTRYVTGVQAGIEVRSGGGTLTTNGFYCRIE